MKPFLFLLSLFAISTVIAQEEFSITQIDSLCNEAEISFGKDDFEESIKYAEQALEASKKIGYELGELRSAFYFLIGTREENSIYTSGLNEVSKYLDKLTEADLKADIARAHQHLANCYDYLGNVNKLMEENLLALEIFEQMDNKRAIAAIWRSMTLTYYDQHNYEAAFEYGRKALGMDVFLENDRAISSDYNNLAIIFEYTGPIDSAIYYHKLSLNLSRKNESNSGIGISLSNLGHNYILKGDYETAEKILLEALDIRSKLGYPRGLAYTHNRLANLYLKLEDYPKANFHATKSMEFANETGEIKVRRMAYERLAEVAEMGGNSKDESKYLKIVMILKDSILNDSNTEELTRMVMNYDFQKQILIDSLAGIEKEKAFEYELDKQRSQRNLFMVSGIFFMLIAIGLFNRSQIIKKSRAVLEREKNRSDDLLLNILPAEVAEELKEKGYSEAKDFLEVTVLFTDFADFTKKAQHLSAKELVMELNRCFKKFDEIITEFGLEKIKTIGDAYMAAGGLNYKTKAKDVVLAAIMMQEFVLERNQELVKSAKVHFDMRCGINSGPVVAGIVGIKKFQYDIWGDTVNTAQRMEVNCELNKVNISEVTYTLIKDDPDFFFEKRPEVMIKGKGMMKMWYVSKKN